jgi:hypothetical protein
MDPTSDDIMFVCPEGVCDNKYNCIGSNCMGQTMYCNNYSACLPYTPPIAIECMTLCAWQRIINMVCARYTSA